MSKDIYFRDATDPKYNQRILETDNKLENLLSKIKMLLYTRKGEVLGEPNLGMNLDDYLFEMNFNEGEIRENFYNQVEKFIPEAGDYNIECDIGSKKSNYGIAIIMAIKINNVSLLEIEI